MDQSLPFDVVHPKQEGIGRLCQELKEKICRIQSGGHARGLQIWCARRWRGRPLSVLCICEMCLYRGHLAFVESAIALHIAVTKEN